MANRLVYNKPVIDDTGLTNTAGLNPTVTGSIPAHISGFIVGIDLKGSLAGVLAGGNYDLDIYQSSSCDLPNRLLHYAAIDNFTISGQIQDAGGADILEDARTMTIGYQNQEHASLLWYVFTANTGAGTFTTPLEFDIKIATVGD